MDILQWAILVGYCVGTTLVSRKGGRMTVVPTCSDDQSGGKKNNVE